NPTVRELEEALADLEGGARALATGSGMGAIASAILTSVDRGNHVVAGSSLYTATTEIFTRLLPRFGIETTFVDPRRRGAWKESVRPDTRLVYLETPANPTMMITDLAEFLEDRRGVRVVHYPGLRSFPQHALARKQMDGFGAMLSFELNGGYRAGKRFVESVDVATLAVSLGGTETLVQHAASMTHGPLTDQERRVSGVTEGLVRVRVGLEHADDVIEDFDRAIRAA